MTITFAALFFATILALNPGRMLAAVENAPPPPPPLQQVQPVPLPALMIPAMSTDSSSSIFAIVGKACPSGADPYRGPEAKAAAKGGVVYCEFKRKVVILTQRKNTDRCPPPLVAYKADDPSITPDAGNLWCRLPQLSDGPGLPPGGPNAGNLPPPPHR